MYILYMDESGVEQLAAQPPHFVLLGLAIPAESWKPLDAVIADTKAKYGLRDVEIHTAWMHRRYVEQESVAGFAELDTTARRAAAEAAILKRAGTIGVLGKKEKIKAYRRESQAIRPYLHLTRDERLRCLNEIAAELGDWDDVRIFAEGISKPDVQAYRLDGPYEMAFEQVLTRFQAFLAAKHASGLVVHDNNSTAAPRLTKLARKFHAEGTFYRQITDIVETPLFVDSTLTSMIQMADLCSFAFRRLLANGEDGLWDLVSPRADRVNGKCVGVRHFTGKRKCDCRICVAHGRLARRPGR